MTAVDRPDNGQDEGREVVHACPEGTSGVTGCCGRTPFELNRWSRMTLDPALVTCRRAGAGEQQRDECSVNCDRRVCEWCPGHDRHEGVAQWLYDTFGLESAAWAVAGKGSRNYFRARAAELLALLGGPQPDGEIRQHRMDADCWCGPVQADNGAWDHQ